MGNRFNVWTCLLKNVSYEPVVYTKRWSIRNKIITE